MLDFGYYFVGFLGYFAAVLHLLIAAVALRDAVRAEQVGQDSRSDSILFANCSAIAFAAALLTRVVLGCLDAGMLMLGSIDAGRLLIGLLGYGGAIVLTGGSISCLAGIGRTDRNYDASAGLFAGAFVLVLGTRFIISLFGS